MIRGQIRNRLAQLSAQKLHVTGKTAKQMERIDGSCANVAARFDLLDGHDRAIALPAPADRAQSNSSQRCGNTHAPTSRIAKVRNAKDLEKASVWQTGCAVYCTDAAAATLINIRKGPTERSEIIDAPVDF